MRLRPVALYARTLSMTLADYLAQPGMTATALAEKCDVSVSTITRAAAGDISPSGGLLKKIHEHTGGAVQPNDFFGIAA